MKAIGAYLRSGDILRVQTTREPLVFRAVALGDLDWVEFSWDWPLAPLVSR